MDSQIPKAEGEEGGRMKLEQALTTNKQREESKHWDLDSTSTLVPRFLVVRKLSDGWFSSALYLFYLELRGR
jgi:hypothetical protein